MFIVKALLIILLIILFLQDLRYRAVSWIIFPAIFLLTFYYQLHWIEFESLLYQFAINLFLVFFQISFLIVYLRITKRSWRELTSKYFAWGDILFLLILGLCFPVYFFLFFLITSIILSIIVSLILRFKTVPLAGFQSILLALVLVFNINTSLYAV